MHRSHSRETFKPGMLPREDFARRGGIADLPEFIPNSRRWSAPPGAVKFIKHFHNRKSRRYLNFDTVEEGLQDWKAE